jgi:2-polyprenyl-3-methyl-5-hydroxy-6-metoxy-1,4-benzoquinol methylase
MATVEKGSGTAPAPICPLCRSARIVETIRRERLPVFQNVVWESREKAIAAPVAPFVLGTCGDCGFSFNTAFDAALLDYDERYDNNVASPAFRAYLQSQVDLLLAKVGIVDGTIYEIGCGKGEFLEMLCASAPGVAGIGIDPSCTPIERGRLTLIRGRFESLDFAPDTRAVVVRHVLEHIDDPMAFLRTLRACVPDAAVFIEVPDLDWILENRAFWDFCYEHCNYFTRPSLATCLAAAGFPVVEQQRSFGGQYQWALCKPGKAVAPRRDAGGEAVAAVQAYADQEEIRIARIRKLARAHGEIAVWGMATKGVVLCSILGADCVAGGIDENAGKQGRYAAGSGVRINPPDWARELRGRRPALVMNPNYRAEIAETVERLGADIELMVL